MFRWLPRYPNGVLKRPSCYKFFIEIKFFSAPPRLRGATGFLRFFSVSQCLRGGFWVWLWLCYAVPQWWLLALLLCVLNCWLIFKHELLRLSRSGQSHGGRSAIGYGLGYLIEISRSHESLVPHCGIAGGFGAGKFFFLQSGVSRHAIGGVMPGQFKHAEVQSVESGQSNKLELVTHGAQFALETGNGGIVKSSLPMEGRRAIVSQ